MSAVGTTNCTSCGGRTPAGKKFCIHCGTPVRETCPTCGEPIIAGARFCAECGATLAVQPPTPALQRPVAEGAPISERRLVSVLFADLVGFTTFSERRDPEEVRDLLSRYFERCRTLIERYGGTVEKFIGDAVMAVWGTPVAREDDAERAVRAALALTQAVALLGEEVGTPSLRARAGVLTGQAAVEVGVEGEGMVLGDTVNTASRLQSIAQPGSVLVDDVTRRASEAAVVYEDAGAHEVKGRERPVHAWTALRVVAGAGGARRGAGLEAPLVGRDRELALIIESFEATAKNAHARLVTVVGEAGSGKSRLVWEFFKYVDGVEKVVRWHQGRCLSYGEGVGYWALAEMVRARAGIVEEEEPTSARAKLHASVEDFVAEERERRLVEPRLAHLLGLEQRTAADRADLFSGWRLFFERIAATEPVVLVFEDLQWADSGLLDFIDYLLEWSADHPLFILGLGRPELLRARPEWTPTITLAPLEEDAMDQLLRGLVPGLPSALAGQIRRRAEGMPLYAVETVRMLLDQGLVAQEGSRYVVTGDIRDLEVPETLQALVAARLDNLDASERTLLQDAAVIGQSFTPATLRAISERPQAEVERLLQSLVAKQVLAYIDDPLSAERGQYVFLQALLRTVALGTLSRRDRKGRHLAVARHLQETWGEEAGDIAEVLASHFLDAVEADPDATDAPAIRSMACETLEEAGRRALSLALGPEALRHFERAAELAEEPVVRGRLLREAGLAARMSDRLEDAVLLLGRSAELLAEGDQPREAARVEGLAGDVLLATGDAEEAAARLARAYEALDDGTDDEAFADLAARRGRVAFLLRNIDEALGLVETALRIADAQRLHPVLVSALMTKGIALSELARPEEATALMTHAIQIAVERDLASEAVRGYYNLAEAAMGAARFAEAEGLLDRGLELARRRGDRHSERLLLSQGVVPLVVLGRWDEAVDRVDELRESALDVWTQAGAVFLPVIYAARGDRTGLDAALDRLGLKSDWREHKDLVAAAQGVVMRETGNPLEAFAMLRDVLLAEIGSGLSHVPIVFAEAVETAFAAGEADAVKELLDRVEKLSPAQLTPLLEAEAVHASGRLAAHRGDPASAGQQLRRALDLFAKIEAPFARARVQLHYAEVLAESSEEPERAQQLRDGAEAVFEQLRAEPWLERTRLLGRAVAA